MLVKFDRCGWAAIPMCILLAACGGGGGSAPVQPAGAIATPAPTPAPTVPDTATAGVTAFVQTGNTFETTIAPGAQLAIASLASIALPSAPPSPAATYPTAAVTLELNAGTTPFASSRTVAAAPRTIVLAHGSTSEALPPGGFRPDTVVQLERAGLRAASGRARQSRRTTSALPAVGDTRAWNIDVFPISGGTGTNTPVPMTLIAVSTHGNIWLDNALLGSIAAGSADAVYLGAMFDGVYTADTTLFGTTDYPATAKGNGTYQACAPDGTLTGSDALLIPEATGDRINVLIPQQSSIGSGDGGYFSSIDVETQDVLNCLTTTTPKPISNEAPTIVIGTNAAALATIHAPTYVRSTMAHELQHLIHFVNHQILNDGDDEPLWIDEGMAMVAEDLTTPSGIDVTGTPFTARAFLLAPQDVSLRAFTGLSGGTYSRNCNACYGQAYLFERYLVDRFGSGVMQKLTQTGLAGAANLAAATGVDVATLISDFDVALAVHGTGIEPANIGTRYGMSLPIGGTFHAGSDQANLTASYPALGIAATVVPGGNVTIGNAILGAPLFVTIGGSTATGDVLKITDTSNGLLLLAPSLAQR